MQDWKQNRQRRHSVPKTGTFDPKTRSVDAVLATGNVINGLFGPERLVMTPEAIDMSRAALGLPWHDDHGFFGAGNRIGRAKSVRLDNGELVGTLFASRNQGGVEALNDIEDGIIAETSIGFEIQDAEDRDGVLFITRWMPLEVSTPSVVADTSAVIQRTATMTQQTVTAPAAAAAAATAPPGAIAAPASPDVAGLVAQRAAEIDAVFGPFPNLNELRTRAFKEGWDVTRARAEALATLSAGYTPTPPGTDGHIRPGEDGMEKFVRAASLAIQTRALLLPGDVLKKERAENPYIGYSLRELARTYLELAGDKPRGDVKSIVGQAFVRRGIISHGTSDFSAILGDSMSKSLQMGYEEAPETYAVWTSPGELPDFKVGHRPQMSLFSDLDKIGESGEFTYGTFGEFEETILLLTYGKLFSLTRQAIINDDLAAFTRVPRGMGRAASRKVGDLVYAILTGNPAMSDGVALFHASHNNLAATGAVPSVATLNDAYTAMATQTDPAGKTLNVTARYILAPHKLRGTIDALLTSAQNPAEGAVTAFSQNNIWFAELQPVYDARLDNASPTAWYLATSPAGMETIEVAYLNGVQTPRLEQQEGFTVDGVTNKVAHDVGAAPLDWRGLYKNPGA